MYKFGLRAMNHNICIRHEIAARNGIFFWEHAGRTLESWMTIITDEWYKE